MRKGKWGLALFSAAVLLMILLLAVHTQPDSVPANPVVIQAGGEIVEIWTADGENYYAFLPGHVSWEEAVILPVQDAVELDGTPMSLACALPEPDQSHVLTWEQEGAPHRGTLHIMASGGVATLYLNTQSGSMDYIHAEKGNAEYATLRLYDEAGNLNYSGDLKSVRGRGNSTWVVHEKKPYSLKLENKGDLLGMGAAKDWILLADALDTSAMRNKIVYDFAAKAGLPYTPEARWTEVYLNGEYAGLYLLCERVEVNPQRVALSPDGSLVCMDRDIRVEEEPDPYFVTDSGQYLQVRESADYGALRDLFQSMENAVLSSDGKDPVTGQSWQELINLESWVKKYLIEEIFDSYDANFQSQYFYTFETNSNSPIYAGPIWDYDASLGNPSVWALNSPRGLFAWRPEAMTGYATPWLHALYEKPQFHEELAQEYRNIFLPALETLISETIGDYAAQIGPSFARNQIRWDVETAGLQEEAAYITEYLQERTEFLTRFWLEDAAFCIVRLQEHQTGGYYAYYAVEPGEVFNDLPERSAEDFLGWYREDTDLPFDPEEPITEDLYLYPRFAHQPEPEKDHAPGMMDLFLEIYHYVPAAVLLMIGGAAVLAAVYKSRSARKDSKKNKV